MIKLVFYTAKVMIKLVNKKLIKLLKII